MLNRTFQYRRLLLPLLLFCLLSCGSLYTARVRQEVSVDSHLEHEIDFKARNRIMVLTLAQEEKTLAKTTLTANEATTDLVSLALLNRGFQVIDRAHVNDFMQENDLRLDSADVSKIIEMGRLLDADFLIVTNLFQNLQASHAISFLPGEVLTSIDTSANIGVSSRMLDLESRQVIWVGIATTQDQNFQTAIQRIADKLIASLKQRRSTP